MNTEKIIKTMTNIVADVMTRFQSDFFDYNKPYIETADASKFPMVWIVSKCHAYLLRLGEFENWFYNEERTRYHYVQAGNPYDFYVHSMGEDDHVFLITEDEVREIQRPQALAVIKDMVTPVVVKWKAEHGPLPTLRECRLPIKFENITLSKLKELIRECEAHGDSSLLGAFQRFRNYRRISSDQFIQISWAPWYNEFGFAEYTDGKVGLVGGIIFHGWPDSGYQENFAVQLVKSYGWSVHT